MDNNELLAQVAVMIRQQTETMDKRFETMDKRFETMDKRFETMDKRFDTMDKRFDTMDRRIDESEHNIIRDVKLIIENDVSKRIDSLFDGYKLNHDKQYELERTVNKLEERLEEALLRITLLESKTA